MSVRQTNAPPEPSGSDGPHPSAASQTDEDAPQGANDTGVLQQIANWPALAVGLAVGVIVGLLLGWYAWPVQWVNAWPGELNPEARAHYIAAVAEAYSYYGDDRAAEIARFRLFDMNENLGEEIAAAQSYFNDNPRRDSTAYINYMARLAQALNVDSPDLMAEGEAAPSDAAAADAPPGVVSPGMLDWLNWAFVAIAAIVLIVGGVYIVYERSRRRQTEESDLVFSDEDDEEIGGFEEDDWDMPDEGNAIYQRPLTAAAAHPPRGAPPEGDVYFEEGDLDSTDDDFLPDGFSAEETRQAAPRQTGQSGFAKDPELESPSSRLSEPSTRPETLPELDYGDEEQNAARGHSPNPPTEAREDSATEEKPAAPTRARTPKSGSAKLGTVTAATQASEKRTEQTTGDKSKAKATPPKEQADSQVIGEYTVQFLSSVLDYEENHQIVDDTGRIIAECGMGVHMRNGYLRDNPEHVIAVDVFLFDKRGDSQLSKNCILLSEYVRENKLEHMYSKERTSDPDPLVAEAGASFQLANDNLVMDCEILEVDYVGDGDAKGIFQNMKVHLVVHTQE